MRNARTSIALTTVLFVVLSAFPNISSAGQYWFSGPVQQRPTVTNLKKTSAPIVATAGSPQLFDVVISLEGNPTGDDDGNTQGVDAQSTAQDAIERIVHHFADGVYESTEGTHKLRKVRIFRNSEKQDKASIVWTAAGRPNADLNGIAQVGLAIRMYGQFGSWNLLGDEIGAGYTLAHEWGHYAYGVRDEYDVRNGDIPVVPSIMNDQRIAAGGDTRWLNFSIAHQSNPPGDFQNTKKTNQHRRYGLSCWETLSREPTLLENLRAVLSGDPPRVYYPTLAAVAPVGAALPLFPDLPGTARSELDVIWMADTLTYMIVIDQSGSMSGAKIDNAKTAAKLLIDLAEIGSTRIGIIAFSSSPTMIAPITTIADETAKTTLRSAIDGLSAGGGTAVGAAAQSALDTLLALGTDDDTKVVFLLSDGVSGDNALSPVPDYVSNQIPILAFAYGSDADTATLGQMATATKGKLYISPVALADVSQAFQEASTLASGQSSVASGAGTASPDQSAMPSIAVDSTMSRLTIAVTHQGSPAAASFAMRDAAGNLHSPTRTSASGNATLSFFDVENPLAGSWSLQTISGAGVAFEYQASAQSEGGTYALNTASMTGDSITYPTPLVLAGFLGKGLPIAGATVSATITAPDGSSSVVALRDDGITPDETANDGRYAAIADYDSAGVYDIVIRARAAAGASRLTSNGLEPSAGTDGTLVPPLPDEPIDEAYERFDRFQVTVDGILADDHGDTPPAATSVNGSNGAPVAGRIETAGDPDVFSFVVPAATTNMAVRVTNLALGMSPSLRILSSDGTTLLGQGTLATHRSAGGYLVVSVPVSPGNTIYAEVRHNNGTSGTGLYSINAGSPIDTDAPAENNPSANVRGALSVAGSFTPGSIVTYTLVLTNDGTGPQENRPGHEIIDVLPPEVSLQSTNATSGTAIADTNANSMYWNGSIPAGGSVTVTINATLQSVITVGTVVENQASISYDGDGLGLNWSSRHTDDPSTALAEDPTRFTAAPSHIASHQVPTTSEIGLIVLTVLLAGFAVVALRR